MSFRRKLLAVFALTVFLSVAGVAWIVSAVTRRAFEQADAERTVALTAQFRREFSRKEPGTLPGGGGAVVDDVALLAAIRAAAMMLDWLGEPESAQCVDGAIEAVLGAGAVRTPDLGGTATTEEVTAAVICALDGG